MGLVTDKKLIGCRSKCTIDHNPCLGCGRYDLERKLWLEDYYTDEQKIEIYDRFDLLKGKGDEEV